MTIKLEICIDSIESAVAAKTGGADRLEVCGSLATGGITPSYGLVKQCVATGLPVMMMLRPNGGNFVYTNLDIECMVDDIEVGKQLGVHGFVFGCLQQDDTIHRPQCQQLLDAIGNHESTFHRAFDIMRSDSIADLKILIELGFDRLLTSGRADSAINGQELIKQLVVAAADRIAILPGSGISPSNAARIVSSTGVQEIHASASIARKPRADNGKKSISFGEEDRVTCVEKVRSIKQAAEALVDRSN